MNKIMNQQLHRDSPAMGGSSEARWKKRVQARPRQVCSPYYLRSNKLSVCCKLICCQTWLKLAGFFLHNPSMFWFFSTWRASRKSSLTGLLDRWTRPVLLLSIYPTPRINLFVRDNISAASYIADACTTWSLSTGGPVVRTKSQGF